MPITLRQATPDDRAVVAEFNRRLALESENKALDMAKLLPGVAERWEITETGATFWLRDTARWSDGKPVTAHDFVFAYSLLYAHDDQTNENPVVDRVTVQGETLASDEPLQLPRCKHEHIDDCKAVALDPGNRYAYVANAASNSVTIIRITDARASHFRARVDRKLVEPSK